jgi:hypothetical protein
LIISKNETFERFKPKIKTIAQILNIRPSKGIGRELTLVLGRLFADTDSAFVLISQDAPALADVRQQILRE